MHKFLDTPSPLSLTMAEDSTKQENKKKKKKMNKQGGLKTMPFILANDVCDRFAMTGFNANLITYLTQELHLPLVQATNTLTVFKGTSDFTPIIGGLIADSFAGRFWTITVGTIIYELGMISLTVCSFLRMFRLPSCSKNQKCQRASWWQLLVIYLSLLLTSIGSGGIRPCIVPFGADQLESGDPENKWKGSFFNLYFFCMGVATVTAHTVVVYIQDNVGWGWGLGVPTLSMFASLLVFMVGYPLYIKLKPGGSPLKRLTQVVVAAIRKRNASKPTDPSLLYTDKQLDADISTKGRLFHTSQLRFFDRAAIVTESDKLQLGELRLWRLSTVHRVEELKCIIRVLPFWVVGILLAASASNNHSFSILQARTMDRHISSNFKIPPASMSVFSDIAMLVTLAMYDRIFAPLARRFTNKPSGFTSLQRIGIGLVITVFCNVSAALVEVKRKAAAAENGLIDEPKAVIPTSVFWLVPQYAIHGIGEAFMQVGQMEFLYDQAPESMRSVAAALYWLAISIGSYLGTVLVSLVSRITEKSGEWLPDNINKGKLDYYYWLVVGLQVVNVMYFLVCAMLHTLKPLEVMEDDQILKAEGRESEVGEGRESNGASFA
ncbi:Proton-dependent oligopeptide transporter family protein [Dioscorea alata]|uniref:Proton-dependent oligopeptide transporter family protein n=1 Tax=Dioscorea alata TaxID=55571 RepID=A0ACB7VS32_DIOAL|nr:Proton-dependent oligopeptide transporter family protein [Dioscorea alata]